MLKDIYSEDIKCEKGLGQVLTPDKIVDYMVKESVDLAVKERGRDVVLQILDPACGTGRFMLGVAEYCARENIRYLMWNIDIDPRMTEATIKHAVHYKIPAVVILGDALLNRFERADKIENGVVESLDVAMVVEMFENIVKNNKTKDADTVVKGKS